jgi:hypothetical protein
VGPIYKSNEDVLARLFLDIVYEELVDQTTAEEILEGTRRAIARIRPLLKASADTSKSDIKWTLTNLQ